MKTISDYILVCNVDKSLEDHKTMKIDSFLNTVVLSRLTMYGYQNTKVVVLDKYHMLQSIKLDQW